LDESAPQVSIPRVADPAKQPLENGLTAPES